MPIISFCDALLYAGDYVYAGVNVGDVYKIDPSTFEVIATYTIGSAYSLAYDGTYLYVGANGGVVKVNPSTMTAVADVVSPDSGIVYGLTYIGTYLYAGTSNNHVYQIDPSTMTVIGTFAPDNDRL